MSDAKSDAPQLLIGGYSGTQLRMTARMANRHGLIAGATGTGKTVTLQILAENFSRMGVPVFLADIKGDLSGLAQPGKPHPKIDERVQKIPVENFQLRASPVVFWDLFGKQGHPLRTTISEMGPLLLSNLMDLNDTQTGVLYACFKFADDNGMLLLDLKDLRSMLSWMAENASELKTDYGNISSASIGAIQRNLLVLEEQGAEFFFNEPAVKLEDLMRTDFSGNGIINVMDATKLVQTSPRLYATFLLWLLAELFENLPEVGDADRPKFVMFFDEAHLLFDDAPGALIDKIEQVVRLIRSKGVGVYFVTQSPLDVPEDVLGQLGMRIQHALRAFTPKDQKAVRTAAQTFRQNPELDTATVITELGLGEALVSVLDEKGKPTMVQQVLICPPESRIGPLTDEERKEQLARSPYKGRYDEVVDRESAYEMLKKKAEEMAAAQAKAEAEAAQEKQAKQEEKTSARRSTRQSPMEAMVKSAARSIGSQLGRQILRGVLGSIFGGKK
ncbi:MAG: helicase HerA-like domain-containing protein [Gammaproteobacteria bacterium]